MHVRLPFRLFACALLMMTNSFAMAQNSTSMPDLFTNETDLSVTMAPSQAPTYMGGISPECANETAAFASDANLTMALQTLLEGYREEFKGACPLSLTNTNCDLNFGTEDNITYNFLCDEMGGQIYEHAVVLTCGLKPLSVDYDLGVVPECISRQCNISAAADGNIDIGLLTNPNITDFASSLDNGGCQAKVEDSSAPTAAWDDIYSRLSLTLALFVTGMGLLSGISVF